MKVYLIGLPGSGKSTFGKKLADAANIPFVDLDQLIEQETGKSVAAIFSESGEAYFRNLEAVELRRQSKAPAFIMACGGGTPCFYENITFMKATGKTLFINVPVTEIVRRFTATGEHRVRPLLAEADPERLQEKLESLLEKRMVFYAQADVTIVNPASVTEVLAALKHESHS